MTTQAEYMAADRKRRLDALTGEQRMKIRKLARGFGDPRALQDIMSEFGPGLGLPDGWVQGWVRYSTSGGMFIGIAPDGESHS